MPKPNGAREQIKNMATRKFDYLLSLVVAEEGLPRPDQWVSRQSVLTEAFLQYARRRHRKLIPKGL